MSPEKSLLPDHQGPFFWKPSGLLPLANNPFDHENGADLVFANSIISLLCWQKTLSTLNNLLSRLQSLSKRLNSGGKHQQTERAFSASKGGLA